MSDATLSDATLSGRAAAEPSAFWPGASWSWAVRGVVAGILLINLVVVFLGGSPTEAVASTVGVASLVFVWRWPYVSLIVNLVAAGFASPSPLALAVAYFMIVRSGPIRWPTVLVTVAVLVANALVLARLEGGVSIGVVFFAMLETIQPAVLGILVRTRRELAATVNVLRMSHERESAALVQIAVDAERASIAREMHDVVSHQVSLIAVHAGAVQIASADPVVKDGARTIRELSVKTLTELRYLLAVLRPGALNSPSSLESQPGTGDLHELISDSGIDVETTIRVDDPLPAQVQRALYRIVQEGLTNARKHAPGAVVRVALTATDDLIVLTMENGHAPPREGADFPRSGHGLLGVRERAELLGGQLLSGPTATGGFRLTVKIPLRQHAPPQSAETTEGAPHRAPMPW